MKTLNYRIIAMVLLLGVASVVKSQSLFIKGAFYNKKHKNITASYELKCNQAQVSSGRRKKIKLRLQPNKEYTLTVSKKGYETKTIHFTTYAKNSRNFWLNFEMRLKPLEKNQEITVKEAGLVYFDEQKQKYSVTVK